MIRESTRLAMNATSPQRKRPLFLLTIDTEEEWDWNKELPSHPFSTNNIEQIPEFQRFCSELSVKPTYFVDHAVLSNTEHAAILNDYFQRDECDIGAHLHPWANPPMEEVVNEHNSHAVNLSLDLFERKVSELTQKLIDTFNAHPYSYRAGRWGMNAQQLQILAKLGYKVDSSVRPFYSDTSFSYSKAKTKPYWPSFSDILQADSQQNDILEIPVTSGFNLKNFELCEKIQAFLSTSPINKTRALGVLWHLGLFRKITATPEGYSYKDIQKCIDMSVARSDDVINMFFHSSDLLPGCTDYVKTQSDKETFMSCLAESIKHSRDKHNAEFTTMRDIRYKLTGDR